MSSYIDGTYSRVAGFSLMARLSANEPVCLCVPGRTSFGITTQREVRATLNSCEGGETVEACTYGLRPSSGDTHLKVVLSRAETGVEQTREQASWLLAIPAFIVRRELVNKAPQPSSKYTN